jgi:hypothetical protein
MKYAMSLIALLLAACESATPVIESVTPKQDSITVEKTVEKSSPAVNSVKTIPPPLRTEGTVAPIKGCAELRARGGAC